MGTTMDDNEFARNQYAKNKSVSRTYVGKALAVKNSDGSPAEKRYVTKVFDIEDFREFYKDQKSKQVVQVLREGQRQEVVAIVDKDTRGFSLRIQRFSKDTGMPHCQSFSFHGGALIKLIDFIDSLGFIDFTDKSYFKLDDRDIQRQKQFWLQNQDLVDGIKRFDAGLLRRLLGKVADKQRLQMIVDSLSELDLENLSATIRQTSHKSSLAALERLLELEHSGDVVAAVRTSSELAAYRAGKPEDVFREWLESNLWVFGVEYYRKHDWRIVADDAIADLVMETADGFIDLIELKRPKLTYPLLNKHSSHNGYYPSAQLSQAIGQSLLYLRRLGEMKTTIENRHNTRVLCPRVKLVVGRSHEFNADEYETMRILNANLGSISVITYDDILRNARQIIEFYEGATSSAPSGATEGQ
jgi:hypothetical protein